MTYEPLCLWYLATVAQTELRDLVENFALGWLPPHLTLPRSAFTECLGRISPQVLI